MSSSVSPWNVMATASSIFSAGSMRLRTRIGTYSALSPRKDGSSPSTLRSGGLVLGSSRLACSFSSTMDVLVNAMTTSSSPNVLTDSMRGSRSVTTVSLARSSSSTHSQAEASTLTSIPWVWGWSYMTASIIPPAEVLNTRVDPFPRTPRTGSSTARMLLALLTFSVLIS